MSDTTTNTQVAAAAAPAEAKPNRFASRKFLVCLVGQIVVLALAFLGKLDHKAAVDAVVYIVGTYVLGESFVDSKGADGSKRLVKILEALGVDLDDEEAKPKSGGQNVGA